MARILFRCSVLFRLTYAAGLLGLAILVIGQHLVAQTESATVLGRVTDPTGAVISNVGVNVRNVDTNVETTSSTNSEGLYTIHSLPPGHYVMSVRKQGFKTVSLTGVNLNVQDNLVRNFTLQIGAVSEAITITAESAKANTTDASVSTVIDRNFAENLPMNGRSFQTLIELTPGVVLTQSTASDAGQFSVNGQRPSSNYWVVDGVSANVGTTTFSGTGNTAGGAAPALSLQGGTNSLVSVDALQEFRIQTSTYAPEFGRTPGAQISIRTRSGTNQFHGTLFEYLRNEAFDANDWFANQTGLAKADERQHDFGGTFAGPILRDKTFFFFSYEGLRLRLPQTALSNVPDLAARQLATPAMQPYFAAFPTPNGSDNTATGIAQFNASYADSSSLDAVSLRIDHQLNGTVSLFARYDYSPSDLTQRGRVLSNLTSSRIALGTATAGVTWTPSSRMSNDFRVNYSRASASSVRILDSFGGAVPLTESELLLPSPFSSQNSLFAFTVGGIGGPSVGKVQDNLQRQINFVDTIAVLKGAHSLKFGVDYRRLSPVTDPNAYNLLLDFTSLPKAEAGTFAFGAIGAFEKASLLFHNVGVFAQDTWRPLPRLSLTYGLRWDVDVAPSTTSAPHLTAATGVDLTNPANLALAPDGTPIFSTKYGNFAPRIGAAVQLSQKPGHEIVLRGGYGIFYDLATQELGTAIAGVLPYATSGFVPGGTLPPPTSQLAPPNPSSATPDSGPVVLFDPNLKLPYTQQWSAAAEYSIGSNQSITATYVGSVGRRLIQTVAVPSPNAAFAFPFLIVNAGTSDYDALQLQFQRNLSHSVQALASYAWAHSIDTSSASSIGNASNIFASQLGPDSNRGPSSFDIRHAFSAALTWDPNVSAKSRVLRAVARGWSIENIAQARTAPPVDVFYSSLSINGELAAVRPDVIPGVPFYLSDPTVAGGKRLNPAAFTPPPLTPAGCDPSVDFPCGPSRQGNLGRNALRAFGAFQWDFAVHREFPIHERIKLQFRCEAFNLLNHPNFASPIGDLGSPTGLNPQFGESVQMLGRGLTGSSLGGEGLSSLYQIGGPRSLQLAFKFMY